MIVKIFRQILPENITVSLLNVSFWKSNGVFKHAAAALAAVTLWSAAIHHVVHAPAPSGQIGGFLSLALGKAFLTAGTEEYCFRGVLQNAAIKKFGVPLGIILQSVFYMIFHLHLGTAIVGSRAVFLIAVFCLGWIWGGITRSTGGIGWAFILHAAVDLVVEWENLA